jgi:glutaredoxin 2
MKKKIIFVIKPKLFSIGTISLLEIIQFVKSIDVDIMDTEVKTNILEWEFGIQSTKKKIVSNRYEPKVALEDKVYPKTYYRTKECCSG